MSAARFEMAAVRITKEIEKWCDEARLETFKEVAKYARDCASLSPDDDVGRAHTRTAEWCERKAAKIEYELDMDRV